MNYSEKAIRIVNDAERKLNFDEVNDIALFNQAKVLQAFRKNRLSYRHFAGTNGYGYGDEGKDTLSRVYADVFNAEDAIVSPYLASGTHALTLMLRGILMPDDVLLSISGKPYDTLDYVINGTNIGSFRDYGVKYRQIELVSGKFDYESIQKQLNNVNVVFITRSKGYEWRDSQSIESIKNVISMIKSVKPDVIVAVDNCYGEFSDKTEPVGAGADVMAGSLIKNPGGGIAPSGGYIAGRKDLIERISYMLTAPGIGMEIGSYEYGYRLYYQGLFLAPSVVKNAIMTSMLIGQAFYDLGLPTTPEPGKKCNDIIRSIKFPDKDSLIAFCQSIQEISPVDSFVTLMPSQMPGYKSDVVMASGAFVAGSSIELSADSPIREPYIAYFQGALTYEHGKLAAIHSVEKYLKKVLTTG